MGFDGMRTRSTSRDQATYGYGQRDDGHVQEAPRKTRLKLQPRFRPAPPPQRLRTKVKESVGAISSHIAAVSFAGVGVVAVAIPFFPNERQRRCFGTCFD